MEHRTSRMAITWEEAGTMAGIQVPDMSPLNAMSYCAAASSQLKIPD